MANVEARVFAGELVWSPRPREVLRIALALPEGSTVADALRASALPGLDVPPLKAGVWGRVQPLTHLLRDRDRVEVYRALTVDPKEARRLRYHRAGGQQALRKRRREAQKT